MYSLSVLEVIRYEGIGRATLCEGSREMLLGLSPSFHGNQKSLALLGLYQHHSSLCLCLHTAISL